MPECQFNSLLEAYHDGELRVEDSRSVERHLPGCTDCTHELQRIRDLSGIVAEAKPRAELLPIEMARLHAAIDRVEERGLLRFAVGMSGIAASILIISAAWLYDGPKPTHHPVQQVATTQQAWEYLASGRPVPRTPDMLESTHETGVAVWDTTHWMLTNLGERQQ